MSDTKPDKVETVENKRKRLTFRSWHRGTREMDLLLGSFADKYLPDYSESQLDQYEEILSYSFRTARRA